MDIYRIKVKLAWLLNKMLIKNAFDLPDIVVCAIFSSLMGNYKYDKNNNETKGIVESICRKKVINFLYGFKVLCWSIIFMMFSIMSNITFNDGRYILMSLEYVCILVSLVNATLFAKGIRVNIIRIKEIESKNCIK